MRRLAAALLALVAAGLCALHVTQPIAPDVAAVRATLRPSDLRLVDRHGALLHERRTDPTVTRKLSQIVRLRMRLCTRISSGTPAMSPLASRV